MSRIVLVIVVVVLVLEAFAPFRLDAPGWRPNGARRVPGGLVLGGPNRAATPQPLPWLDEVRNGAPFTVSVSAEAADPHQDQVARLLTISRDYDRANLVIAQYEDDLIVRVRRAGTDASGEPPARVTDVFSDPTLRRIRVERRDAVILVSVDGRVAAQLDLGSEGLRRWDTEFRLALGDEHAGSRSWAGTISEAIVDVGSSQFDYLGATIEVPRRFWYMPERVRNWLSPGSTGDAVSSVAHGVSFTPVGWLALRADSRRRTRRAAIVVTALSFALVLGKVWFAGRHPSLLDLVAQGVGGLAGVGVARQVSDLA